MLNNTTTTPSQNQPKLLNAKDPFKIGYWNVRSLYQIGKQAQVCREMSNYGIHILGISECRWTGSGKLYLRNDKKHIIYSGRPDLHMEGVAIIMTSQAEKALLSWESVNERIITARFQTRFFKLSIIQCYAPTNDASDLSKDTFYNTLVDVLNLVPKHDIIIVMGDFNAKIGDDNRGAEKHVGKYGIGELNQMGKD